MNKRIVIFLLAASMLISGCGSFGSGNTDTTTAADTTIGDSISGETDRTQIDDGIGEYDFKNNKFTVVYCAIQVGDAYPYNAESEVGEILNDSIYKSHVNVEERFNVDIEYYNAGDSSSAVSNALRNSVLADDNAYQLAIGHMFRGFNGLVADGLLYDFMDVSDAGYIDFTRPWWNQSLIENITINNTLLTAVSDYVYNYVDVIYFNKQMLDDNGRGDPYQMVIDGTWTWDKLIEMAKDVTKDVNNDGILDIRDQYGYTCSQGSLTTRFVHSNGLMIGSLNDEGKLGFENVLSEKMQSIVEKAYSIYWNEDMTYVYKLGEGEMDVFMNGRAMFSHALTSSLDTLRDTEFEFGIVPLPKGDESQEKYQCMASSQMLLLPAYIDPEFSGVVLEALSAESYKHIVPALYEMLYQNKYLRDENSFEMYQIIRDSLVYDPIWIYGDGGKFAYIINETAIQKSTDLSSFIAANKATVQKTLEDVSNAIFENYS